MKKTVSSFLILISLLIMNTMTVFAGSADDMEGGISWGLVIIGALIIAAIVCLVLNSSMKSVHTATSAKLYEKEGTFVVVERQDNYTHTTQERIHHEPRNNS